MPSLNLSSNCFLLTKHDFTRAIANWNEGDVGLPETTRLEKERKKEKKIKLGISCSSREEEIVLRERERSMKMKTIIGYSLYFYIV